MRTSVTLSTSGPDEPSTQPQNQALAAPGNTSDDPGDEQSRPFQLTPKRKKAIEAVRFIAAHLKNEDDYAEVTFYFYSQEFICLLPNCMSFCTEILTENGNKN